MVFFQKRLSHTLVLHPSLLGPALPQHAREQLVAEVEGRPVDDDGFIVTGAFARARSLQRARGSIALLPLSLPHPPPLHPRPPLPLCVRSAAARRQRDGD